MFKIDVDDSALAKNLSDLELKQLPFATMNALNDAMFAVRDGWAQEMAKVFDRPNQLTINAVLYKKATKQNLVAEVYLRNEASQGTPPSRYLLHEVTGGARDEKPFEYVLRRAGLMGADEYVVPARGFPLDAFGNVPGSIANAIIADLQAATDTTSRSNAQSRSSRARRKIVSKRAVYFESSPNLSASQGKKQHLPRGIYQRTAFGLGSSIRMVFFIVKGAPRYKVRFDAQALAQRLFSQSFAVQFSKRLKQAVATARL